MIERPTPPIEDLESLLAEKEILTLQTQLLAKWRVRHHLINAGNRLRDGMDDPQPRIEVASPNVNRLIHSLRRIPTLVEAQPAPSNDLSYATGPEVAVVLEHPRNEPVFLHGWAATKVSFVDAYIVRVTGNGSFLFSTEKRRHRRGLREETEEREIEDVKYLTMLMPAAITDEAIQGAIDQLIPPVLPETSRGLLYR